MKKIRRAFVVLMLMFILVVQIGTTAFAMSDVEKKNIDKILGVYEGSYTASQGITGLTLSIYKTQELISNDVVLQEYADIANFYRDSSENSNIRTFTVEDIKAIILKHNEEYIAIFNYFPLVYEDTGNGPNLNVEEGLYTMTVDYNESTGTYDFIGSEWIQHDTYVFVNLKSVTLANGVLEGEVYQEYEAWYGPVSKRVGDVSVSNNNGFSGYRIDFENSSASLGVNEKQQIKAVVKSSGTVVQDGANIEWFSGDESVATIKGENWGDSGYEYATATITGISEGMTTVFAKLENGRVAMCTVVVSQNGTIASLEINTSYELISSSDDKVSGYQHPAIYKISAVITNPDINPVTNVIVNFSYPVNVRIYGEYPYPLKFEGIKSGGSITATWCIIVERDEIETLEVQYSVSAESDQCALILDHKTIFVEPDTSNDNCLDFEKDVWGFINIKMDFYKNFFAQGKHYLNSEHYNALTNAVNNIERERIETILDKPWGGSCYGMSVISILAKMGHLDPHTYDTTIEYLKDLPKPKNSQDVFSLITYYHVTQKLDAILASGNTSLSLDESERLKALVRSVENTKRGETPVLLCIYFMNRDYDRHSIEIDYMSGHAIVAYDVEYGSYQIQSLVSKAKDIYDKRIVIYDPNNNRKPIYMYINSDYTKWIVEGYCQNRTSDDGLFWKKDEGYFFFINDANILDSIHIDDSIANDHSRLISNTNTKLRITAQNKNGKVNDFVARGINIFEFTHRVVAYADGVCGLANSTGFGYIIDEGVEELRIVPDAEESLIDLKYEFPDVSYTAKTSNGKSVVFSENKYVFLQGEGNYVLSAIYNEGNYESSLYYYKIEGEGDGIIGLMQNAEGYTIISGDNLNGIDLTVKGSMGIQTKEIFTDAKSILLKDVDESLQIYIDEDNDGSYETNLEETKSSDDRAKNLFKRIIFVVMNQCIWVLLAVVAIIIIIVIVVRTIRRRKRIKKEK